MTRYSIPANDYLKALQTWKRDPDRFECSFKYGMYESWRMNTGEMLNRLLIELD